MLLGFAVFFSRYLEEIRTFVLSCCALPAPPSSPDPVPPVPSQSSATLQELCDQFDVYEYPLSYGKNCANYDCIRTLLFHAPSVCPRVLPPSANPVISVRAFCQLLLDMANIRPACSPGAPFVSTAASHGVLLNAVRRAERFLRVPPDEAHDRILTFMTLMARRFRIDFFPYSPSRPLCGTQYLPLSAVGWTSIGEDTFPTESGPPRALEPGKNVSRSISNYRSRWTWEDVNLSNLSAFVRKTVYPYCWDLHAVCTAPDPFPLPLFVRSRKECAGYFMTGFSTWQARLACVLGYALSLCIPYVFPPKKWSELDPPAGPSTAELKEWVANMPWHRHRAWTPFPDPVEYWMNASLYFLAFIRRSGSVSMRLSSHRPFGADWTDPTSE